MSRIRNNRGKPNEAINGIENYRCINNETNELLCLWWDFRQYFISGALYRLPKIISPIYIFYIAVNCGRLGTVAVNFPLPLMPRPAPLPPGKVVDDFLDIVHFIFIWINLVDNFSPLSLALHNNTVNMVALTLVSILIFVK